ncbi:valine--tRNA ligase [Candidatus Acetothermia bacterium]|nr:valine--tRNA ligase [Candidatus Acetothermia bacterium]
MELPKAYEQKEAEDKWYSFWESKGYFKGQINPKKKPFSIVIPPPNVTGGLHMGHALNNTLQDIAIRYKRMDGYSACWFPGMDHASIAVHVLIEKSLANRELDDLLREIGYPLPNDKRPLQRHDLGRDYFMKLGWAWKARYGHRIREQLRALGCSCDWERERFTMDEGLSNAVKEVFVRLYEEGFIYYGERLVNWCPRCMTTLSDLEVEREEQEAQIYFIRYPLAEGKGFITIATTRPETMLADTGVAVHPDDERYQELIGKSVILPLMNRKIPIVGDEAVDREFGTGALKVTPGHDPVDFEIGRRHGLKIISIFNKDATTNDEAGKYQKLDRYVARERVVEDLKSAGLLDRIEKHKHAIGHCQRCNTVVEPLLSPQWFMRMEELAKPAIKVVETNDVEFIPDRWKKIYFDWMLNIRDWPISRQLWWGHRIPAWHCADCHEITVARKAPAKCAKCGSSKLEQDPDVLDTWFSSALWPFSIMGWPTETPDLKYFYATSLLSTGHDIIFFWVARMIMMGLHFRKKIPFQKVFFHPIIKDAKGQKMSKSKGNVIDPLEMKEEYGMDALRFTLAALTAKGKEMRLAKDEIEGYRRFLNKLWNASRFTLINLAGFDPSAAAPKKSELTLEDRWILSRLNRVIAETRESLESYDFNVTAKGLYDFVWHDFCDWYLELIKPRFYEGAAAGAKQSAQYVLHQTLTDILKLLHPFIPFITEEIYQKLPGKEAESIMISEFPTSLKSWLDESSEKKVRAIQSLITAIRTIRAEMNIPPQKPAKVLLKIGDKSIQKLVKEYELFFKELAQTEELTVDAQIERPKSSPVMVLEFGEVFLPLEGLIDIPKEKARLRQEMEQARKLLDSTLRKLNNKEFLEKAPAEIIEKEKSKAQEFKEKLERLEQNLALLMSSN